MSTFYLDPEGGNDSNDGTSFANRKKTIAGFSSAIIAPGDEIRIIASKTPGSVGTATWTDGSSTVVLDAAKNATIDNCDTNWTGSTNVTSSNNTTTARKEGTQAISLAIAGAFTTGKIAYRTLPAPLDLSAYEAISFWFSQSANIAASTLRIDLCSDSSGDTPVDSFTIDFATANSGVVKPILLNKGSALGSAIASIAIVALLDPGTVTVTLDNIIACKALSAADHLSHVCLIGKKTSGEPEWYPIRSIDGVNIVLGGNGANGSTSSRPYKGTTENVGTYHLLPLRPRWSLTQRRLQDDGTESSPIQYSGGWDRTAMSTQSGETWISMENDQAEAVASVGGSGKDHVKIGPKIGIAHCSNSGIWVANNTIGTIIDLLGVVSCPSAVACEIAGAVTGYADWSFGNIVAYSGDAFPSTAQLTGCFLKLRARRICMGENANNTTIFFATQFARERGDADIRFDKVDNLAGKVLGSSGSFHGHVWIGEIANVSAVFGTVTGMLFLDGATLDGSTLLSAQPTARADGVHLSNVGGDPLDHRTYKRNVSLVTATDQRHTESGVSWKVQPTDSGLYTQKSPFTFPLARLACKADETVVVSVWVRRTNTALNMGLMVREGVLLGVVEDVDWASGSEDTWEQLSISFTPTTDGVVEIYGLAGGGTTHSGWFDDLDKAIA